MMRQVVLFCLLAFATAGMVHNDETVAKEFVDVYFLKSVSGGVFSAGDLSKYNSRLQNVSLIGDVITDLNKLSGRVGDCDKSLWLHCGVEVLGCVKTCRNGTFGNCIDCLGGAYKDCCPCVQEYVRKIPCSS